VRLFFSLQQQTNQNSTAAQTAFLNSTVEKVACSLGYLSIKKEQRESILEFIKGNDAFVSLPTGLGKSLCFTDDGDDATKVAIRAVIPCHLACRGPRMNSAIH
jgi:superfamily II DNA or RNA helicase